MLCVSVCECVCASGGHIKMNRRWKMSIFPPSNRRRRWAGVYGCAMLAALCYCAKQGVGVACVARVCIGISPVEVLCTTTAYLLSLLNGLCCVVHIAYIYKCTICMCVLCIDVAALKRQGNFYVCWTDARRKCCVRCVWRGNKISSANLWRKEVLRDTRDADTHFPSWPEIDVCGKGVGPVWDCVRASVGVFDINVSTFSNIYHICGYMVFIVVIRNVRVMRTNSERERV